MGRTTYEALAQEYSHYVLDMWGPKGEGELMARTEELLQPEFDKWVVYGHDTDDGGADFEYLLSRPTAFSDRDCGCVKMRRRVCHDPIERHMITTHGKRQDIYPLFLEEGYEDELKATLDRFCEAFMREYKSYTLNWGRYE